MTCSYAACRRLATTSADGWYFCDRHYREHHLLAVEDAHRTDVEARVGGRLLPSMTLDALLAVLDRHEQAAA